MARKRPSDDELKAMLREGHFGPPGELAAGDPIIPTPMLLPIDRIAPYERNPRRERNPAYDEIRASIRASGLRQPLVVTRRPGDRDRFIVRAGGNTRLEVLKELYAETGDERFREVHCLFEPWTRESDALAAHLVENDTRGDLTFIDKARAVRDLRQLVEAETDERLTQEKLAAALAERGYRIERSLISRMDYALDVLLPCIPEALRAGLGRDQVQRIRNLERAVLKLWRERALGEPAAFEAVFGELLARYDGPEWQLDRLRRAVEYELAERAEEDLPRMRLAIDALLEGREPPSREAMERATGEVPVASAPPGRAPSEATAGSGGGSASPAGVSETASGRGDSSRLQDGAASGGAAPRSAPRESVPPPDPLDPPPVSEPVGGPPATEPTAEHPPAPEVPAVLAAGRAGPGDLKSLRARAWVLATRIAQRHHLGDIVVPVQGCGSGYLVDFVYTSPVDDPDTRLGHASLWWFLATASEQFYAPPEKVLPHLPEAWTDKPIARAIGAPGLEDHTELLAEYALIGFGHLMGPLVFATLPDNAWTDLVHLMDTYRRLRRGAAEAGRELWEAAP